MQVGSLVQLKQGEIISKPNNGEVLPAHGIVYTIREMSIDQPVAITLLEIVNPRIRGNHEEVMFLAVDFIELQPPMTIKLEELISEPQTT